MVGPTSGGETCPTHWSVPPRSASTWCGCPPAGPSPRSSSWASPPSRRTSPASPPPTPPGAWSASSAACAPSAPAGPGRWPPPSRTSATPPPARRGNRAAVLVAQLEQGTIGDAPTLERLLRDDVLGPEHPAAGAARPRSARRGRRRAGRRGGRLLGGRGAAAAGAPRAHRGLRPRDRRGPCRPARRRDLDAELQTFLASLRDLDDAGRARWRAAVDEGRAERRPWAGAMHEACWAAHVSGRTRDTGRRPAARRPGVPRRRVRRPRRRRPASGTPSPGACRAWPWPTCSTRPRSRCSVRPGSG